MKAKLNNKIIWVRLLMPLFIIFHLCLLLNTRFTAWPEMILWPYLMLKGWLPYRDIAIAHTPLLLLDLAVFNKIFGLGLAQLKVYTYLTILVTDLFLFKTAEEIYNRKTAVLTLLFYIPLQLYFEGNGLWFDLSLTFFGLLIFYTIHKKSYAWAGALLILAFFTKQTAVWFIIPAFIQLTSGMNKKNIFQLLRRLFLGAMLAAGGVVSGLLMVGIFWEFYFWAIKFGTGVLPLSSGQMYLPTIRQMVFGLLPFATIGGLFLIKGRKKLINLVFWAAFSFLGVFPRWELFHFQPALPFLAIVFALSLTAVTKQKTFYKILFSIVIFLFLYQTVGLLVKDWRKTDRFFEPSVIEAVSFIDNNTSGNEMIYVLNAWDHIYALSNTLPATQPWIPQLSWYIDPELIQKNVVKDLDENKPRYVVLYPYTQEGLSSYRPEIIANYVDENYVLENKTGDYLILIRKEQ